MADSERKPLGANYWQQLAGRGREVLSERIRTRLACPDDDAPLEFQTQQERYVCTGCARVFRETEGHLSLLPSAEPYQLSDQEMAETAARAAEENRVEDPADLYGELWNRMAEQAGDLKGKLVLDLCCGTGWAAAWFARKGAHVAATDITAGPGGLSDAAAIRDKENLRIDLFQADVVRLPFAPATFDIVFVSRALHLMKRPERMSKEIGRLLQRDGNFLNLGEPIGEPARHERDPRHAAGGLSLDNYKGIYAEGGMSIESHFPEPASPQPGIIDRLRHQYRSRYTKEKRLLVGKIPPGFQLPSFRRKDTPHG